MAEKHTPPHIDYLARDFEGFRQLMLDHLSVLVPGWQERAAADQGSALIDVLAYAADYLSYYQDAVATEMYLGTARLRRSVRRHAQLLDYHLREGCSARAWARIQVRSTIVLPRRSQLLTGVEGDQPPPVFLQKSADHADTLAQAPVVFETMHDAQLFAEHNEIAFDPAGPASLATGAVSARLSGALPNLCAGDVLVIAELRDPASGLPLDPRSARRHPLRITRIERAGGGTTIYWDEEDALPFPLRLYRDFGGAAGLRRLMSAAWGNIVLADHGRTIADEELPPIPAGARYRPRLRLAGLTHAAPYDHARARATLSAAATLGHDRDSALPAIELTELWVQPVEPTRDQPLLLTVKQPPSGGGLFPTKPWTLRRDLLSSSNLSREYIVEMEDDGSAYLRFGFADGGWQPSVIGAHLLASYRIGCGTLGNIGRDAIESLALDPAVPNVRDLAGQIVRVSNPLAAQGGAAAERIEAARLHAPHAFRSWEPPDEEGVAFNPRAYDAQARCVTPDDYASIAMRHPEVAEAVAVARWTGSWVTLAIHVRRRGGWPEDAAFCAELRAFLEPYRLAGYDLAVLPPCYVPLEIALVAHLAPDRQQSTARAALRDALIGPDGFFAPEGFGFGQPVHRSRLVARAATVDGVAWVTVARFRRAGAGQNEEHIAVSPLEIARLPRAASEQALTIVTEGGIR